MATYALFRCPKDEKLFKVVGGMAGYPSLREYDGSGFNHLCEIKADQNTKQAIVAEGMRLAGHFCSCGRGGFKRLE